jgi:putative Mg2+ transporter-C (MgtC) family protein
LSHLLDHPAGLSAGELVLRLCLALVLCGLIGIERETRGHVAGLRTHILVGVGAALFTIVSAYGFQDVPALPSGATRIDPTRIAAQIVTGVGFLGAGAIIRQGFTVRGLTTAATLWMVAAIGLAVGAGVYGAAILTTILVLVALTVFRRFRPLLLSSLASDLVFVDVEASSETALGEILAVLSSHGVQLEGMDSERGDDEQVYRLELRVPRPEDLQDIEAELRRVDRVSAVNMQSARIIR